MKSLFYLTVLFILIPLLISAQKKLSIEDASGMNRSVYPQSMRNLQWQGATNRFTYLDNNALMVQQVNSEKTDTLLSRNTLKQICRKTGVDTTIRFNNINWINENQFIFTFNNDVYKIILDEGLITQVNTFPEEAENIDMSEDGRLIAYTIENNLFIAVSEKQIQVTNDENKGIVNGQTVHRNEFGIEKGTFWSPDGRHLAYYKKDETMVSEYPIVDINPRVAAVESTRYPMAGMASEQVTLVVFHLADSSYTNIQTGLPADQYLTSVTFSPDNEDIYIAILNRDQNHLKLNRYSAVSGELELTLFEEKSDKYVEPEHALYFLKTEPSRFIWFSERDGFQHLYLYNTEGLLISQLTDGPWMVTSLLGTDDKDSKAYFLATKNSPLNEDLFSVDLKKGTLQSLSLNTGSHYCLLNANGKYILDINSDTLVAREYSVIDAKGRVIRVISRTEDPLQDYAKCQSRIFTLEGEHNTPLYAQMITPPGFDPQKKYPVIVYVYGGPHAQLVQNTWLGGAGLFNYYLAQQGYIIFTLDNRGSANRGRDFEQAIFRNAGTMEVRDQMTGVNYLKSLPYVDPERIGVQGWSYGGFMTISLMLREPDVFKVGVCGGPVTDWKYYEVMYGERYMDTPEDNPEGYEQASLLNKAANLKGDLLIIHGTSDPVVVWQHSLALIKRFIEEGKMVDYFVYPGHGHGVGGKDRLHLNRKIEKYFSDHL
jgi:dipeptidyl-peptidase-4